MLSLFLGTVRSFVGSTSTQGSQDGDMTTATFQDAFDFAVDLPNGNIFVLGMSKARSV